LNKTIEIVVSPKGETTITTTGFTGPTCREASGFLEKALGRQTSETLTPEFYQTTEERTSEQQRQ
jgi:hypothetical protein